MRSSSIGLAILLVVSGASVARSAELSQDTLTAWNQYVGAIDSRSTASATDPFLQIDQWHGQAERVRRGEVIVSQIKTPTAQTFPHALIHHWMGDVFIPDTNLAAVLAVARNYEEYPKWYGPTTTQAKLLERSGDDDRFSIRYVRTVLWATVVMEAEYESRYVPLDETHGYAITRSVHIDEIQDYGKPSQRKKRADDGSGYIWRTYSVSRYQQRDNGVYIEQENIALSRPFPSAFRWLVESAIRRVSKDLLEDSLQQTREAVHPKSRK